MTLYIGLDVHKKGSVYCCQDENGRVIGAGQLPHSMEAVRELIGGQAGACVALEATGSWQHVAAMLASQGAQVVLSHPRRTRAIASAKVKTDAIDARTLADLLRGGLLPQAYLAPPDIQALRRLVRTRASLVETRTRFKNQVHGVLTQAGFIPTATDVFGKAGRGWMAELDLPPGDRVVVETLLREVDHTSETVRELDRELLRQLGTSPEYRALLTLPGFGPVTSATFLAEVGDMWRFKRARYLLSYLGIVPRVHSSGGRTRFGRLTKEGPPLVRNVLVQAAYPAIRKSPELREVYDKTKQRHGSQVARIAVARKLATLAFHTLKAASSPHVRG